MSPLFVLLYKSLHEIPHRGSKESARGGGVDVNCRRGSDRRCCSQSLGP